MRTRLQVREAQEIVLEAACPLPPETVAVADGLGRILAESVGSDRTLPPADCSAMDGYAVRAEDLEGSGPDRPRELPVVFEVAAGGQAERALARGEAARIFSEFEALGEGFNFFLETFAVSLQHDGLAFLDARGELPDSL